MPSRQELQVRAAAIGLNSTAAKYFNDSVLEQAVIFAEKAKTPATAAVQATTTLTASGNPANLETMTLAGRTYTFVTTLDNATPNQILIGAAATNTLDNIKAAISPTQTGQGTTWSYPTTPLSEITCGAKTATTLVFTARNAGVEGNAIVTTETSSVLAFTGGTMASGVTGTGPTAEQIAAVSGGANV